MTLQEALRALGNTPEQVSDKLRSMGIKGERSAACRCPIAQYLKACGFHDPFVANDVYAKVRVLDREDEGDPRLCKLPECVDQWINAFDEGKYPEFDSTVICFLKSL